jgi:hypothetical protein
VLWRSLKTRDEKEANFRCAPIAKEIERRIAEARKPDNRIAIMTVEIIAR